MLELQGVVGERTPEQTRDPGQLLRSLAGLKSACVLYPDGHPSIDGHVEQAYGQAEELIGDRPGVEIDILRGIINVDGESQQQASRIYRRVIDELASMGIDSIHIDSNVSPREFRALGEYLAHRETERQPASSVAEQLKSTGVAHISLGRILPVDSYLPGQ